MLVEFMEGGGLVCGWVTDLTAARGRLEVRMEGGRSITLSPSRILTRTEAAGLSGGAAGPSGQAAIDELVAAVAARRAALAAEVDLQSLWEALDGEEPELAYELLAGLCFGRDPAPDDVSALIRAVKADGIWFEFSPSSARRRPADEIERLRHVREREAAKKILKDRGAAWLRDSAAGLGPARIDEAEAVEACLRGYLVRGDEFKEALQAKELLKLAGFETGFYGAFRALVGTGAVDENENVDLLRLGRPLAFGEELLSEAERLAAGFDPLAGGRLDLTALFTATVDAPGAKEFDDAMSLEPGPDGTTTLWLHIADPAALLIKGSILDAAAAARAATVYLPETRYPMLPEVLTEGVMSLVKNQVRPAFSLKIILGPGGEPVSSQFVPSLVKVDLQLSFAEAESDLLGRGEASPLWPFLEVSRKLSQRRLALGGSNLKLPRATTRLGPNGLPEVALADLESLSGLMVEEMMILANHLAAKTLSEAAAPCPYRYQDKSLARVWNPPPDAPPRVRLAADLAARKLIGRVGVTLDPSVHHGVGLGVYTSFTSPMRRYLDLVVARQLRSLAVGGPPAYDHEELLTIALDYEADYRAVKRLQTARQRYWLARLLAGKTGERFVGLVYERRGRKAKICVTEYMLELELFTLPASVEPGQDVLLRLQAAEPRILDRPETLIFEYLQVL